VIAAAGATTCLGCGCLCDDVDPAVEGGRIVAADRACELGMAWFLADRGREDWPAATVEGRPVEPGEALERAAEILAGARAPIVLGFGGVAVEDAAAAVAIADRLGAVIDPSDPGDGLAHRIAEARVGRASATLGEVRQRADTLLFWGVDPLTTHPRHAERYSIDAPGRFVAGRRVIVADDRETATAARADLFIQVGPDRQRAALDALRGLASGLDLDDSRLRAATGVDPDGLRAAAGLLTGTRYGAAFYGPGLATAAAAEALFRLVRALNERSRFVALPMGGPGNRAGVEAALTWQAGAPRAVDYAGGAPRYDPPESTAESRLARGAADAALIVGDDPRPTLSAAACARLDGLPVVWIGPVATDPSKSPSAVGLACGTTGIDADGTVFRVDGIALPLRPPLPARRPAAREWLRRLNALLEVRGR